MTTRVSIITPSFNKVRYLDESLKALISQTYENWEMIIVDDRSTDGSQELIKQYIATESRIRLIENQENRGANYCRNKGLQEASGKYIIFFDADDLLAPTCLENRVKAMENNPRLDFYVFTMAVFREQPGDTNRKWVPDKSNPLKCFLSHDLPWQTMQPIWNKETLIALGGFDERFPRLQDVELHTRALLTDSIKYKVDAGEPDCFLRIEEARKNYNAEGFLSRWVQGVRLYYEKFYEVVKNRSMGNVLTGTVFHAYIGLLVHYKSKKIDKATFRKLEQKLLDPVYMPGIGFSKRKLLQLVKWYNLLPLRIPGINYTLNRLIIR